MEKWKSMKNGFSGSGPDLWGGDVGFNILQHRFQSAIRKKVDDHFSKNLKFKSANYV